MSRPRLMMAALAYPLVALTSSLLGTFRSETNWVGKLNTETWVVPRFTSQYKSKQGVYAINRLIERAVANAEASGARVLTLGLLNQAYELNRNGEMYIIRKPNLQTKIVDGTSLAAAAVVHMIPEGAKAVLLLANANNKMSFVLSLVLCEREIRVEVVDQDLHDCLRQQLPPEMHKYLVLSQSYSAKVWLVGDGLMDQEQAKAQEGVHFVPYSQFPPKAIREDCIYHSTPALLVPEPFQNLHGCENWLPRGVMSAWRAAGMFTRWRSGISSTSAAAGSPASTRRGTPRLPMASGRTTSALLLYDVERMELLQAKHMDARRSARCAVTLMPIVAQRIA